MKKTGIILAAIFAAIAVGGLAAPAAAHSGWSFGAAFNVGGFEFVVARDHGGLHVAPRFFYRVRQPLRYQGYRCHGGCEYRAGYYYHHADCPLVQYHFRRHRYRPYDWGRDYDRRFDYGHRYYGPYKYKKRYFKDRHRHDYRHRGRYDHRYRGDHHRYDKDRWRRDRGRGDREYRERYDRREYRRHDERRDRGRGRSWERYRRDDD